MPGNFLKVFGQKDEGVWDGIVTCFFLDVEVNVLEMVSAIHKMLKEGGTWINLGPLCYHFSPGLYIYRSFYVESFLPPEMCDAEEEDQQDKSIELPWVRACACEIKRHHNLHLFYFCLCWLLLESSTSILFLNRS